ncbi:U3 protein [Coccidioides immitis RMSCC 3703]|uniref:U3 protein n=1 Tax=Coccidioides immitis RMSCC 3703 TaxID=454286 RepID=A0A0J8QUE4_COCIT|nr:U3 protein [Coccidioides immitis RMSCC 3703]
MPSFFTIPASQRKRKREDQAAAPASKKRGLAGKARAPSAESRQKRQEREESISGSESDDDEVIDRRYLENIKEEVDEAGFDAAEIDRDLIAERLKEDVDESKGRTYRQIASQLSFSTASHSYFRADTQSTTSVAVHSPYVYTVSKDKTLIKWELIPPVDIPDTDVTTTKRPARPFRKKPKKIRSIRGLQAGGNDEEPQGHTGNILAVAVSPSGKFVATGGADKKLIIWDADTLTPLKTFTQHRDSVSGLSFTRRISAATTGEQLFSSSFDRTLKTWSLSPGSHAYVETLFGHQDHVISVASMVTDQCVSVGARDRTARLWKVVDETQLVFRGGGSKSSEYAENSIDCGQGSPAHFLNNQLEFNPAQQINGAGVNANVSSNEPPLNGIVNDIAVFERRPQDSKTSSAMKVKSANNGSKAFPMQESTRPGLCIVAALGKEHRLGRWKVFGSNDRKKIGGSNSGGRNGAVVFEVAFRPNASVIES